MQHVWLVSFVEYGMPGSVLGVFATCMKAADFVETKYPAFAYDYANEGHGAIFLYRDGGDTIKIAKHNVQE